VVVESAVRCAVRGMPLILSISFATGPVLRIIAMEIVPRQVD